MKILLFAFGGAAENPYLPHNHVKNAVVYTGNHDNDTIVGWFKSRTEPSAILLKYLNSNGKEIHWDFIRAPSLRSPTARLCRCRTFSAWATKVV
jgi:4-alpha-glucanotransferase